MTDSEYLKAIEQAFIDYRAGDIDQAHYDRAVEAALRAWRGYA